MIRRIIMKNAFAHPVLTTKIAVGTGVVATVDGIRAVNNHTLAPVVNTVGSKVRERKYLKAATGAMKAQMLAVGKSIVESKEAEKARLAQEAANAKLAAEMEADIAAHPVTPESEATVTEAQVDATINAIIEVCDKSL
jgi:hypothetical protein